MTVQEREALERFYAEPDPWQYEATPDDAARRERLLGLLPRRSYRRTLDVGAGNGFLSVDLPGETVTLCDLAERALHWARERAARRPDAARFRFVAASLFDLRPEVHGAFDLVVVTGVLYPQYLGGGYSLVDLLVDGLLEPGGVLVSCQIDEWYPHRFPYSLIDACLYRYRDRTHRLEVFLK